MWIQNRSRQAEGLKDSSRWLRSGRWFSLRRNEVSAVISMDSAKSWMSGKTQVKFIEAGGGAGCRERDC